MPISSTVQGFQRGAAQSESETAAGGGPGLWKLHEQGTEGERVWLQNVLTQQDR